MPRPSVFISFSTRDREIVRRIFARLEAQEVNLWNYADEAQEIPGGEPIPAYLMERIEHSDFFLPLVSANSFGSNYAQQEVRHALARHALGLLRVVPMVIPSCLPPETWHAPYDALSRFRYRMVNVNSSADLEEAVAALCVDMGVSYLPLPPTDPRLPFMARFVAEIENRFSRREERDIAVYRRLMGIINEFNEAFGSSDFQRALARIVFFIGMCEYEAPHERFYYPFVVKGVCEIACGQLVRALETFNGLMDHPNLDESVFSGLGYIRQQQGMYREALEMYRKAVALCPTDPAARAGEVTNALLSGERIDLDTAFEEIEKGVIIVPEDRIKIRALKAFALGEADRLAEAEAVFAALERDGHLRASTLVNFADVLERQGKQRQARALLGRFHRDFPEGVVLHRLATLGFQIGDRAHAVEEYGDLVQKFPTVRQYRIDAAQVFWCARDRAKVREMCLAVLDRRIFPLPATPEDFYLDGFAQWFLGNTDRAEYDFERSGQPASNYYPNIIERLRC